MPQGLRVQISPTAQTLGEYAIAYKPVSLWTRERFERRRRYTRRAKRVLVAESGSQVLMSEANLPAGRQVRNL